MPFISKDWRSPGEEWVKTVEGWEKKKILECANNKTLSLLLRGEKDAIGDKKEKDKKKENAVQPHCHITLKCTREGICRIETGERTGDRSSMAVVSPGVLYLDDYRDGQDCNLLANLQIAGFNGLSDALKRLDFLSAVHDCRRFNYIVRLLDLLVSHRMGGLSGCAQRVLFNMLEEVALEVSLSQQQTGRLRRLIERVRAFSAGCCWGGRPLGSVILWEKHKAALERILQIASSITITQPDEEQQPQWSDLPPECRREVLLRLSDPRDIEASSEACEHLAVLAQEQRIWRELAQYHFTPQQIATTRQNNPGKDWKTIFTIARRSFGLREEYAEMIQLCRNCRCLFWRSLGHPCIADQDPAFQEKLADVDQASLHVPIPPQTFLKFFSL
ncbi:F-box only protein [Ooceraea biroi]|uniref:F-box only protein n=1 Tax=Ooceraea biroi TaxID=2015173 RepID=A0A026W5K3_OOCBI|nr:F-box only protein [Ooceraea biroi]